MKTVKGRERKELKDYAEAIRLFDAARVFHLLNLKAIEELVKRSSSPEIREVYDDLRGDLYKIAYYPAQIPKFRALSKRLPILRALAALAGAYLFLSLAISQFRYELFGGSELLFFASLLICMVVINAAVFLEYKLRKQYVRSYESKGLPAKKARIKKATQFLINRLVQRIEALGENPENHAISILHGDYENVSIKKSSDSKTVTLVPKKPKAQRT